MGLTGSSSCDPEKKRHLLLSFTEQITLMCIPGSPQTLGLQGQDCVAVVIFQAAAGFFPRSLPVPPQNCETANQTDGRFEVFAF